MLRKLFSKGRKKTEEMILAPATGKLVELEQVPDPTFSEKMMGDGFAIEPVDGAVVAPLNGEIIQLFPTKHAVGIRGASGIEILVHIGLETVGMNGEGFEVHVKEGNKVKAGQPLVSFDLELIKEKAASTITPIVITNGDIIDSLNNNTEIVDTNKGETEIMNLKVKD